MGKCFVIQPFDNGEYDKRFDDVIEPAIQDADLEPYRVDRDPSANIPIEKIEKEIENSSAFIAEISTDNPNVWYELGYAFACSKPFCLICSEKRIKFPFDIQHKKIIKYKTESTSDFDKLTSDITERLKAVIKEQKFLQNIKMKNPTENIEGLSPHEMAALKIIMQNKYIEIDGLSAHKIREDMNTAGFTDIAASIAIEFLLRKEMIETKTLYDDHYEYTAYAITQDGIDWILKIQDKLKLKVTDEPKRDSDLPF